MNITLDTLLELLLEKKYKASIQKETHQIYVTFLIDEIEFPCFIKIIDSNELIQIITFIPFALSKNSLNEVARLLHILNKELDIPGFGLDEENNAAFFRYMLPTIIHTVDAEVFLEALRTAEITCKNLTPAIGAVIKDPANLQVIVNKIKGIE